MKGCDARRYSDTMTCGTCGLQWDVKDPDPPECLPVEPDIMTCVTCGLQWDVKDPDPPECLPVGDIRVPFKPARLSDHADGFSASPELERRTVARLLELLK